MKELDALWSQLCELADEADMHRRESTDPAEQHHYWGERDAFELAASKVRFMMLRQEEAS